MEKTYDRTAEEPYNAVVVIDIIADPYSDTGEKIRVTRSLRNDPLAGLYARRFIDEAEYQAGRLFQRYAEQAEIGNVQGVDPAKVKVDGGVLADPLTDGQRKAMARLREARHELGSDAIRLLRSVLIDGQAIKDIAAANGMTAARELDFIGRLFRTHLNNLAVLWRLAMQP